MNRLEKRLAALETFAGAADASRAYMVNGASDDDVAGVNCMSQPLDRQPGETLAELVGRAKALNPMAAHYVMFFEYADSVRQKLGVDYMPDALPNT